MPENKNITLHDVAKRANVSIATVSRVLNGTGKVSPDITKAVEEAIDELGYYQNSIARSLKTRSTFTIAFVTADISNPYMITVARAVEEIVSHHKYTLLMCSTKGSVEQEKEYLQMLMARRIDALVLNGTGYNESLVVKISKQIPVILLHRRYAHPDFRGDYVDSDNESGVRLLTEHLLSFGHRKIFIIKGNKKASANIDRLEGFKKAMNKVGINVNENYPYQYGEEFSMASGYAAIDYLCSLQDRPTAVLAFNNTLALGALKSMMSNNVRVPEDLSIVSFNQIDYRELMVVRPTVYAIKPTEIGLSIGYALIERLADNQIPYRELFTSGELIPGNGVSIPTQDFGRKEIPKTIWHRSDL